MKNIAVSSRNTYYAAEETPAPKSEENMNRKKSLLPLASSCILVTVRRTKKRKGKENASWLRRGRYAAYIIRVTGPHTLTNGDPKVRKF